MREKLIALLKECKFPLFEGYPAEIRLASQVSPQAIEYIADYLIEQGVKL